MTLACLHIPRLGATLDLVRKFWPDPRSTYAFKGQKGDWNSSRSAVPVVALDAACAWSIVQVRGPPSAEPVLASVTDGPHQPWAGSADGSTRFKTNCHDNVTGSYFVVDIRLSP